MRSEPDAATFTPASLTPTLPLQIADRIGVAIIEEQFAPGERLKEVELASAFGVSRASVREALRHLQSRGLVRILPQRGAQVTLLSRRELENLFEIRAALLGLAARHAARHYTPSTRDALDAQLGKLAASHEQASAYARASAAMVEVLARASANEQLAEMIGGFAQRIGRYTRLGLASRARRTQSLANWRRLTQAMARQDEAQAEAITRQLALENRDAALDEIERRAKPHPIRTAGKQPRVRTTR